MAYANFKATVWSKYIQQELERKCKLVDDCWKQFEGEAKRNEKVKILGVGSPTIGNYTGASIGSPETVADSSIFLDIDIAKFFNFMVGDVDKAQSVPGLMEALMDEATKKMALTRDSSVAALAASADYVSSSLEIDSADEAKAAIDAGILQLRENDVDVSDDVVIEIPAFVYGLMKDKYIALDTNNSAMLAKGIVGMYDGCKVKMTNNLYSDGTDTFGMIRTKKAIAFAGGIDEVEAYRPQDNFADAMKGLNVYGCKIIRPKELYVIKAHKAVASA